MLEKKYGKKAVFKKGTGMRKLELELEKQKWELEEEERNQLLQLDA